MIGPGRLEDAVEVDGAASQFAQKCTVGPEGERMSGTFEHLGHILSVKTYPQYSQSVHLLCHAVTQWSIEDVPNPSACTPPTFPRHLSRCSSH